MPLRCSSIGPSCTPRRGQPRRPLDRIFANGFRQRSWSLNRLPSSSPASTSTTSLGSGDDVREPLLSLARVLRVPDAYPLDARSQLILCGNFLVYLFLLAWERRDIERAYRMLECYHQTIHELGECDNLQAKTLLRAAMLRIDSFFSQAAQIMRHGGDGAVTSMLN